MRGISACVLAGFVVATAAAARAEPSCADLAKRIERQSRLNRAYDCRLSGRYWRQPTRNDRSMRRCDGAEQARLSSRAEARAVALELCLAARLITDGPGRPRVSRWPGRPAGTAGSPRRQDADASAGTAPPAAGGGEVRGVGTHDDQPRASRQHTPEPENFEPPPGREESARQVRDLLAQIPVPPTGRRSGDAHAARHFRSGLVWSYGGKVNGMHCVQWLEPSDPHDWYDNYLCTRRDFGLQWSYRGPILGRGLKCIQVNEPSDPDTWHDNYFCWPRDLDVNFRFSATGRIPDMNCVAIVEPSDPNTWRDNYLCYRDEPG